MEDSFKMRLILFIKYFKFALLFSWRKNASQKFDLSRSKHSIIPSKWTPLSFKIRFSIKGISIPCSWRDIYVLLFVLLLNLNITHHSVLNAVLCWGIRMEFVYGWPVYFL